jgi:hypothetical protein
MTVGGADCCPQGIHFEDENTLLLTAHYNNQVSRVHRVRLADRAVLGWFDFDQSLLGITHINSISRSSDGRTWFAGNTKLFAVDLEASFASNSAVITTLFNVPTSGASFMDIATINGTEYVLCGQYMEKGTPTLTVFPFSQIVNGGTHDIATRTIRYVINQRTQGIRYHNGKLYLTLNRTTSDNAVGYIHQVTLNLNAADGSSIVTPDKWWYAPSQYPEDLAFHPVTGDLWTPTEGLTAVGSHRGFLSIWSTTLSAAGSRNDIAIEYNGVDKATIKMNGYLWDEVDLTPTVVADTLTIGGIPQESSGFSGGFSWATVANVMLRQGPMTAAEYTSLFAGAYEPYRLTKHTITLVNPGAETGNMTGWTAEVGAFDVVSAFVAAEGTYYFRGGVVPVSLSRQRVDLIAQGVPQASLETGEMWAKLRWKQAAYGPNDPGGMGIRSLAGDGSVISTQYSGLVWTTGGPNAAPGGPWFPRSIPVTLTPTTRSIDALLHASGRTAGTNNDCYIDDVSIVIYSK